MKTMKTRNTLAGTTLFSLVLSAAVLILLGSCSKAYYSVWEKLGKEKRHLLIDHVEDVQQSQTKAKEEFKDALTRIKELTAFEGGELETFYNKIKDSYEDCDSRAGDIEHRIKEVKEIAADLFKEWEGEINQIKDARLKTSSQRSLRDARKRYAKLEQVMERSTRGMYPVLDTLNDYMLYLKHNLNAKAVGALGGEVASIEKDIAKLIKDMNLSINEAEQFISSF